MFDTMKTLSMTIYLVHGMIIIILTVEILRLLTPQTKIPPTYYGLPDDDQEITQKCAGYA